MGTLEYLTGKILIKTKNPQVESLPNFIVNHYC